MLLEPLHITVNSASHTLLEKIQRGHLLWRRRQRLQLRHHCLSSRVELTSSDVLGHEPDADYAYCMNARASIL